MFGNERTILGVREASGTFVRASEFFDENIQCVVMPLLVCEVCSTNANTEIFEENPLPKLTRALRHATKRISYEDKDDLFPFFKKTKKKKYRAKDLSEDEWKTIQFGETMPPFVFTNFTLKEQTENIKKYTHSKYQNISLEK